MRAALVDGTGQVTNVIVLSDDPRRDPFEPADVHLRVVALTAGDEQVTFGWIRSANNRWVAPPPPVVDPALTVSPDPFKADGTATTVATYTNNNTGAPASVVFTVNGATATVPVAAGVASLDITSTTVGPVDVSVDALPGLVVTVTAN